MHMLNWCMRGVYCRYVKHMHIHEGIIWLIFECKKLLHTFCNVLTLSGLLQVIEDWKHALQNRQSIDTHCFFKYKFSRLIKGPSVTNNSLWHLYAVVAYAIADAVFHHRALCVGVTHPRSFHLEPEFSRWISSSSLFLFSTLYSPCKSSQSLSPPRLLWCDLVGKSWLRPASPSSWSWCQSSVHSFWCAWRSLSLQCIAGHTSCIVSSRFVLHVILSLMLYCRPVVWLLNVLHITICWQHLQRVYSVEPARQVPIYIVLALIIDCPGIYLH